MERLSIQEAALRLRVSQDVVRGRIRNGELRAYRQSGPQGHSWVVELPENAGKVDEKSYLLEQGRWVTPWWRASPNPEGQVHYVVTIGVEEIEPQFLCGLVSDNVWGALGHAESARCPRCEELAKEQGLPR